jgi:hypothetical protein
MPEPVNRTMLLFDIEGASQRDDVVQTVLRRSLNTVVDETLAAAGAEDAQQYCEDRGDGVIVLISGDIAKTAVLRALLTTTPDLLREHNRLASAGAQMRLRVVLAAGEVAFDPHDGKEGGLVGHDLNMACRLLDSTELRRALRINADAPCVLMVSPTVYEGVVRHGHRGVRPETFKRVQVKSGNGLLDGWLYPSSGARSTGPEPSETIDSAAGPGGVTGSESADHDPEQEAKPSAAGPAGAVFHFHGSPTVHGSIVGGAQHGVSGGRVDGVVVLGGTVHGGIEKSGGEAGRTS